MREVLLNRVEERQIGIAHELRPALAIGDPPGPNEAHRPCGQLFLECPAEFCR